MSDPWQDMPDPWQEPGQSSRSWRRRSTPEPTARGAAPKSAARKRCASSRDPPQPPARRLASGGAYTVVPPPPTRSPPPTSDAYRGVASFDDARAPWSRDTLRPIDQDEEEPLVIQCARERWVRYAHKYTPQASTGWRPHMAGCNDFQCYECGTVFADIYVASGLTRAADDQAMRQAGRAARRYAEHPDSTVPRAPPQNVSGHPADAYLGVNQRFLRETDDLDYPLVVNDKGGPQPVALGTAEAKEWFVNSTFNGEPGDLIRAWRQVDAEGNPRLKLFKKSDADLTRAARAASAAGVPGQRRWQEEIDEVFSDSPDLMFPTATHCLEPPVAYPDDSTSRVPLCALRDVESQGEHMGSDWCKGRTGRICSAYATKCNYGRLCPNIHTVS